MFERKCCPNCEEELQKDCDADEKEWFWYCPKCEYREPFMQNPFAQVAQMTDFMAPKKKRPLRRKCQSYHGTKREGGDV